MSDAAIRRGPKAWLIDRLPAREQVRWRYWYRRLTGRLDPELVLATRLALRGRVAVDVGANTGVYTVALARLGAHVEAFEPLPALATLLESAADTHTRVHRVALGRTPGLATIYVPRANGRVLTGRAGFARPEGDHDTIPVRVAALDDFDFRDVGLVKVDVEGHELAVLEGAQATLARERPVLLVEIEARHLGEPVAAAFARIASWGYAGFFWDGRRLCSVDAFDAARLQVVGADGEPAGDAYVNNFLFVHAADPVSLARLREARA